MHPEILTRNISYRFRSYRQFNPQELQYMLLHNSRRCTLRSAKENMLYLKPKKRIGYTKKKLKKFDKHTDFKFVCINSLDKANKETRKIILDWIEKRIDLKH